MRLAMFEVDADRRIGVADGKGRVVDVSDIVGDNVIRLICQAEHMLPQLDRAVSSGQFPSYAEENVRWLPPVPAPGKICGIAMNQSASDHPEFFLKPSSCLVGHGEPVRVRRYYGNVHPGPALGAVIGKAARDVDAVDACDHIFGYTIFNDITGDGNDTFGCMGPWLVTADQVASPNGLDVSCAVAGRTVSEGNTHACNYRMQELVSFISQFQTLEPGDVISCGVLAMQQTDLQDVAGPVDVSIANIGTLSNPVIVEDRDLGDWRLPERS